MIKTKMDDLFDKADYERLDELSNKKVQTLDHVIKVQRKVVVTDSIMQMLVLIGFLSLLTFCSTMSTVPLIVLYIACGYRVITLISEMSPSNVAITYTYLCSAINDYSYEQNTIYLRALEARLKEYYENKVAEDSPQNGQTPGSQNQQIQVGGPNH